MNKKRLDEILARAEAATLPPWEVSYGYADYLVIEYDNDKLASIELDDHGAKPTPIQDANANFMAKARQDVPDLIAFIDENRDKMNKRLSKSFDRVIQQENYIRQLSRACRAASEALNSYQYGNSSPDLAEEISKVCDIAIAAAGGSDG